MTTRTKRISNWWLILLLLLGLAGIAAGTFFDLPIDQAIYSPDATWARALAACTPAPAFWGIGAAGILMIDIYGHRKAGWLAWLLAFGLNLIGPVYLAQSFQEELGLSWFVSWAAGFLLAILPAYLYWFLMRKADEKDKKICMWILLIVCLGSVGIVQVVKRIWLRPRYLAVISSPDLAFHPWYQSGKAASVQFAQLYESNHDLFRSFPSGHTQSAACLFCWALIPVFTGKGSTGACMGAALVLTLITAFSRLVLGNHFLSDVSVGFLITYLLFAVCVWSFRLAGRSASVYDEDDEDDYEA